MLAANLYSLLLRRRRRLLRLSPLSSSHHCPAVFLTPHSRHRTTAYDGRSECSTQRGQTAGGGYQPPGSAASGQWWGPQRGGVGSPQLGVPEEGGDAFPEETLDAPGTADGEGGSGGASDETLDLLYDPVLNCYFDPKTNRYYELKAN